MEFLTNSERMLRDAKSNKLIKILKIDPYTTCFAGKGNMSRKAAVYAFRQAAKRQMRGK